MCKQINAEERNAILKVFLEHYDKKELSKGKFSLIKNSYEHAVILGTYTISILSIFYLLLT